MAIQAQLYSENFGLALGAPQDLMMESSFGFDNLCFVPQQQQQLMQFDQFQNFSPQKNLNFLVENNNNIPFIPKNNMNDQQQSMAFSQSVSAHIEKQRMEFEQFINLQVRKKTSFSLSYHDQCVLFIWDFQQTPNLQFCIFVWDFLQTPNLHLSFPSFVSEREIKISNTTSKKATNITNSEEIRVKAQFLLTQKQEEITKAANRTMELQEFLKRMEIENQSWQRVAKENESMVASLNSTIQRLRESQSLSANAAEDAESCCQNGEEKEEKIENKMVCKGCNSRNSCVVLLPCRHLCSCKDCEVFLDSCPVCRMVKKGSIIALI
ncbi:hypothetical protein DH2020_045373 [Rehmannia glutinosa]|uniref:RING-type domain-containing protein n=1 Tax=Rehmannia glutinosa TaxID=99300 RepID=A0ABR0UEG9_REHGL